jgi:mRNA interferase MazF
MNRGQLVLVDFPYSDGTRSRIRPALVIQSDVYNAALRKTVIAMITGNLKRRANAAHVFLDPVQSPALGLDGPSLVSCVNLFTIDQSSILRSIGKLTDELQAEVDQALCDALSFSMP